MEELLKAFDGLRAEHEGMTADTFNDDSTYKRGINQARSPGPPPRARTPPHPASLPLAVPSA